MAHNSVRQGLVGLILALVSSVSCANAIQRDSAAMSGSTTPTATAAPAYYSWGCYTEGNGMRALSEATLVNYTSMTIGLCADFCITEQDQSIFGLEYGGECYCGTSLNTGSTAVPAHNCNMVCGGNVTELCGAANRLNVYGVQPLAPSSPTTSGVPQPTSYSYIGCFTEGNNTRALNSAAEVDYESMTIEMCASYCFDTLKYTLFGTEYGGECYCGDALQQGSVAAAETDCSMICDGNYQEICGGPNRLSMYQATA